MVNPQLLVSACPFCRRSLNGAAQRSGSEIKVLDIVELVAEQLKE
jgi:Fe-S oxidoreductase